jgi:nicotinamide-nucleotide amidase
MRCEIINIGSEFLGRKNSSSTMAVAGFLSSVGIKMDRIVTVGDNLEELSGLLKEALERSDVVLTIGGMGSTPDDITRAAVSGVAGRKLEFSRKAMENVARFFALMGEDVPKSCDSQAYVVSGAEVLINEKEAAQVR